MKRIDRFGLGVVALLVSLLLVAAYAALHLGWFKGMWEMAAWFGVAIAFLGAGLGIASNPLPRNTGVYGSAKPASESEAEDAARGKKPSASLHDQSFPD